jgi:hypothetical protein
MREIDVLVTAIEDAVLKYRRLVKLADDTPPGASCSLCSYASTRFARCGICEGCPIFWKTGKQHCTGTPFAEYGRKVGMKSELSGIRKFYSDWIQSRRKSISDGLEANIDLAWHLALIADRYRDALIAELLFLERLLGYWLKRRAVWDRKYRLVTEGVRRSTALVLWTYYFKDNRMCETAARPDDRELYVKRSDHRSVAVLGWEEDYRELTRDEAVGLRRGDRVFVLNLGRPNSIQSWRVNGAVKTWKTRRDFRVPLKYGMWGFGYLDQSNFRIFKVAR